MFAANLEFVSPNILVVTKEEAGRADPQLIVDDRSFSLFRCGKQRHVYLGVPARSLTSNDVKILNDMCDGKENTKNIRVKQDISFALSRHFNGKAFHINEFGCGKFPLSRYFAKTAAWPSYHGIERDTDCLSALARQGVSASDWCAAMARPAPSDGRPSIATSIYALHFIVNNKLPKRIAQLTSEDGFFVGNFYKDANEMDSAVGRTALSTLLEKAGMSYIALQDPVCPRNEFWMVSRAGNVAAIHDFSNVLKSSILIHDSQRKQERRLALA